MTTFDKQLLHFNQVMSMNLRNLRLLRKQLKCNHSFQDGDICHKCGIEVTF